MSRAQVELQPISAATGSVYRSGRGSEHQDSRFAWEGGAWLAHRVHIARLHNVMVEGKGAVIHNNCNIFVPSHGFNLPLHEQFAKPNQPRRVVQLQTVALIAHTAARNFYHFITEVAHQMMRAC